MKKIAYITGTRADLGLSTPLLEAIEKSQCLKLILYATGMHLMPRFGETLNLVKEKFPNVGIINVRFDEDSREGMVTFAAKFMEEVVSEFKKNMPDMVLVHGDRVEMLCTALLALYLGIPIVHTQGGDKTTTVDDSARHAITKLAHLHFPATEKSAKRIRLMGEEDWRIHVVGTMGVDALLRVKTLSRQELFKKLDLQLNSKVILVLQHPVSEQVKESSMQMQNTINAVKRFNLPVVVVYPNADMGSSEMVKIIQKEKQNPLFRIFKNLDHPTFISLEKAADCWVGNSSAGVVESSSFKTPVVNVGIRQEGRERGANVIDVKYDEEEIYRAIYKSLFDENFKKSLENCINPWGDGKATKRILKVLENIVVDSRLMRKK